MLATGFNLVEHLQDHPWPGCQLTVFGAKITWMSSGIASMIFVAVILAVVLIITAQKHRNLPKGGYNLLEVLIVFVRDMIAKPALHDKSDKFLPLLLTLFVFVLGMNLVGLLPLGPLSVWLGEHFEFMQGKSIGVTPTQILSVCAALAMITLSTIVLLGLKRAAVKHHQKTNLPMAACLAVSPLLWVKSLSPNVPGPVGVVLVVPLALLELMGAMFKCFALMVRLFANMMAGHALLAALMMFVIMALEAMFKSGAKDLFYIAPVCIFGSVLVDIMELLVSGLQAYIFTFLSAMFLNLYVDPEH